MNIFMLLYFPNRFYQFTELSVVCKLEAILKCFNIISVLLQCKRIQIFSLHICFLFVFSLVWMPCPHTWIITYMVNILLCFVFRFERHFSTKTINILYATLDANILICFTSFKLSKVLHSKYILNILWISQSFPMWLFFCFCVFCFEAEKSIYSRDQITTVLSPLKQ